MQLVICASPTYLRKYGAPQTLYELDAHRCSGFRRPSDGRVSPWRVRVGDSLQGQNIRPSFSTNDEAFELRAVLAGEVIGQLAVPTAASLIRAGRLVPILLDHMTDNLSLFVYYGSRAAQPARVRRFIDLAVERLTESKDFVFTNDELLSAHAKGMAALLKTG
jgi:DNA-binding transcriptional LysR family regulator